MGEAIGHVEIFPDPLALARHVAEWMTAAANAAKGPFRVSLSGGMSRGRFSGFEKKANTCERGKGTHSANCNRCGMVRVRASRHKVADFHSEVPDWRGVQAKIEANEWRRNLKRKPNILWSFNW